ncbi:enoyl-CoA hydratase-related protein [Natronohydrobacter thiooxidans]|uniref:enoyl-CoA hydratase-related protein n=1 Tax=Natronohydrobacter thiooxidans TaxID=87172 RepID=UPI0008FF10ED|nr:enoyl-CoA hydratase-related protein [Natronohydrobacter thiooxidans]
MSDLVIITRPAPGVALLRLNRPEARNALNSALRQALTDAFATLPRDASLRAIVITGDDRAFMAGADLREFATMGTAEVARLGVRRMWNVIAECPLPVIAAVNGAALGGGLELAMHADIIVAGEGAKLGQPEITVGIMPGGGGTQRLVRALGKFKAMNMLLTGAPVTGRAAFEIGLASEVVADDQVLPRALAIATRIAALPPLAARRIKEVVLAGEDAPLATGIMLERRAFETLFDTADKSEGMSAFLEKRAPEFKGE